MSSLIESVSAQNATYTLTVAAEQSQALIEAQQKANPATERTSSLVAPSYRLTGHKGAVNSLSFSHNGEILATGGKDSNILLWDVFSPTMVQYSSLSGHKNQILQVCWSHDDTLISAASADTKGSVWDVETGVKVKSLRDKDVVNAVSMTNRGSHKVLTGGDSGVAMLWDVNVKHPTHTLNTNYPITSVALNSDATIAYTGGIDETVTCWDLRTGSVMYHLPGHTGTITSVALSSDESTLLTNATDNSIRSWDVRAFISQERQANGRAIGVYAGHVHDKSNTLIRSRFSDDGSRLCSGSADGMVYLWDLASYKLLYKLEGHAGTVTDVQIHPSQPIIASASVDGTVFVGEVAL